MVMKIRDRSTKMWWNWETEVLHCPTNHHQTSKKTGLRFILFCMAWLGIEYQFTVLVQMQYTTHHGLVIKSNFSLCLLYYAEACKELERPISASFRSGNTALSEEMLLGWRAISNTASKFTRPIFEPHTSNPETNALLLDQLTGSRTG